MDCELWIASYSSIAAAMQAVNLMHVTDLYTAYPCNMKANE
jgi:hypothetical protein